MTHMNKPDLAEAVIALVADTFDLPPGSITETTAPGEIDGWDSLGHSVLLTRISRRFRVIITEDLATPVATVAGLIDNVRQATAKVQDA